MKQLVRWLSMLTCVVMLWSLMPMTLSASAANTVMATTQLKYTQQMANPLVNVTSANDGSFKMTMAEGSEGMLSWNVSVDVTQVPYWIVHIKDINVDNASYIRFFVQDFFVSEARLDDEWLVVDLTPYADKGIFTGSLQVLQADYLFSSRTGKKSNNEISGMWLSKTANLDGKVNQKKQLASVNFKNVITKKTVIKYDDLIWDSNIKSEKVSENSFAMWVDPDQELEWYGWWGCAMWRARVDLNKVPYLYVNLAENETAYCLRLMVLTNQGNMKEASHFKIYNYVTAGHSGWQVYDLKNDIKAMGFTGVQYLSFDFVVDDGSSASGAQNFIKEIYLDTKLTPKSGTDTTSQTQSSTSQVISSSQPQSSEPDSGSSIVNGAESSDPEESQPQGSVADISSTETNTSVDAKAGYVWIYIVIAVIVVLAAAGVGTFFFIKKKKKINE